MLRTFDPSLYGTRRDAFLDVAQHLVQVKGYEAMTIQEVLDTLDASKGSFYHYFDSKQALLEAVVVRMVDDAMAEVATALAGEGVPAIRKLESLFATANRWKTDRRELMLSIIEVWASDGNAVVREKIRRMSAGRLVPVLSKIIGQGIDEGVFASQSPDETATVLVILMQGFGVRFTDLFVARQAGTLSLAAVQSSVAVLTGAFARILGISGGESLTLVDEATLHLWFG